MKKKFAGGLAIRLIASLGVSVFFFGCESATGGGATQTLNNDASLASAMVKGRPVNFSGGGEGTFADFIAATVSITSAAAADDTGVLITVFTPVDATGAEVRAVKVTVADLDHFATEAAFNRANTYNDEAVTADDVFIVKVTAENGSTVKWHAIFLTIDDTGPVPGTLNAAFGITAAGFTANWTAAKDEASKPEDLKYTVYYKTSSDFSETAVAVIEVEGRAANPGGTAAITALPITGLAPATTYYYTVIAEDEAGNKAAYAGSSQMTAPDTTAPVPGRLNAASGITAAGFTANWTAAEDDINGTADLKYTVYYATTDFADNTITTIEAATPADSVTGETSKAITGLAPETTYYYTVIVEDKAGNKAAYTKSTVTTAAGS
jgi:phosphodiesterase/alkaline phosphatase D-like protein